LSLSCFLKIDGNRPQAAISLVATKVIGTCDEKLYSGGLQIPRQRDSQQLVARAEPTDMK